MSDQDSPDPEYGEGELIFDCGFGPTWLRICSGVMWAKIPLDQKPDLQKKAIVLYGLLIAISMLDNDASTAKTLTLVAIVLQLIFTLIGIIGVAVLIAFLPTYTTITTSTGAITYPPISAGLGFAVVLLVVSISLSIGVLWILLDYFLVYKKLQPETVKEAETPSLVLGILQLMFGGMIPGILLIVSYVKIRDSLQRNASTAPPTRPV